MNLTQANTVEIIHGRIVSSLLPGEEIKRFKVTEYPDFVAVMSTWGRKDDERGLLFLTRKHIHFFIGPRGGVTYPVRINGKMVERSARGKPIMRIVTDMKKHP